MLRNLVFYSRDTTLLQISKFSFVYKKNKKSKTKRKFGVLYYAEG